MLNIFTLNDDVKFSKCLASLKPGDVAVLTGEAVLLLAHPGITAGTSGEIAVLSDHAEAFGMTRTASELGIRTLNMTDIVGLIVDMGSPLVWK